ncbi:pteridine transporter ft4, putative [Leishmania tarentolae]|uniref:Pteridine transporter ft4, putative n=1 Tax=Leishmania tarentolae TaxID=5689 RepID=A0A640K9Y8_LEITA|nr:pteridine transporter ft4, putative [Leishmania tarentolae]
MCPCMRVVARAGRTVGVYGPRPSTSIYLAYFFFRGVTARLTGFSRPPMLKKYYALSSTRHQRLTAI